MLGDHKIVNGRLCASEAAMHLVNLVDRLGCPDAKAEDLCTQTRGWLARDWVNTGRGEFTRHLTPYGDVFLEHGVREGQPGIGTDVDTPRGRCSVVGYRDGFAWGRVKVDERDDSEDGADTLPLWSSRDQEPEAQFVPPDDASFCESLTESLRASGREPTGMSVCLGNLLVTALTSMFEESVSLPDYVMTKLQENKELLDTKVKVSILRRAALAHSRNGSTVGVTVHWSNGALASDVRGARPSEWETGGGLDELAKADFFLLQVFRDFQDHFSDSRFDGSQINTSRVFTVHGSADEGTDVTIDMMGPYRQLLTTLAKEWSGQQSSQGLPLFEISAKQRGTGAGSGTTDRFTWIPNCNLREDLHEQLFRFIGQLLGCMIMSNVQCEILWAQPVWKWLVGDEINKEDLPSFNAGFKRAIDFLENCDEDGWSGALALYSESFDHLHIGKELRKRLRRRQVESSDQPESLGMSLGMSLTESMTERITMSMPYAAKESVVRDALELFTNFCKFQLDAISEGLYSVVPKDLLQMFDAEELETLLCGSSDVSVAHMRANMEVDMDVQEQANWVLEILEAATPQFRSRFLGAMTGQTRMMGRKWPFTLSFSSASSSEEHMIRFATCSTTTYLPKFSSKEITEDKLYKSVLWGTFGEA